MKKFYKLLFILPLLFLASFASCKKADAKKASAAAEEAKAYVAELGVITAEEDLNLPKAYSASNGKEVTISYKSNSDYLSDDGQILKRNFSTIVTTSLDYTAKIGDEEITGSIEVKIMPKSETIDARKTSIEELNDTFKQSITDKVILEDKFNLPTLTGAVLEYTSGDESYLSNEGEVLRRPTTLKKITMNYKLSKDGDFIEDSFELDLYPKNLDAIYSKIKASVPERVCDDVLIDALYDRYYHVSIESDNEDVLTSDGEYIRPADDTEVHFSVKVYIDKDHYKLFDLTFVVLAYSDNERLEQATKWLKEEVLTELQISSDIALPKSTPDGYTTFSWTTSNEEIMTSEGKVTRNVFDRFVELDGILTCGEASIDVTFWYTIEALDISEMSLTEVIELFTKAIARSSLSRLYFSAYTNITQTFNGLVFFQNEWQPINDQIVKENADNRPGTIKQSTQFICVHDTANNREGATAKMHADYVNGGGGGTSFSYVVGNDGIYHMIPDNEVSYHAGDSTKYHYKLYDTGVKATAKRCNIAISADGYFTFNGVKSVIHVPEGANANSQIASAGLFYIIGDNGNYWLNENYYNTTYYYISNRGGNNNSIGIETCVDQKTDYLKTLRLNANLVAKLLVENNLDPSRVMQHNNFSGKPCPMAMRQAKYWQNFRDMVSLIYFGRTYFDSSIEFIWTSQTEGLSNDGFIVRNVSAISEVKYNLCVKQAGTAIYTKDFTTTIIK